MAFSLGPASVQPAAPSAVVLAASKSASSVPSATIPASQPLSLNEQGVVELLAVIEPPPIPEPVVARPVVAEPARKARTQVGKASWYGPGFHGKKTASGEVFDQNELSAAHPTLALDSLVRVTNLENGTSVVVKINDRGPYKKKRIIDLSKRAAAQLGFVKQGIARVRIEVLRVGRG